MRFTGYIYLITNDTNGRVYVGQTTSRPEARLVEHITNSKKDMNSKFCVAIREIGEQHFRIHVLEMVEEKDVKSLLTKLTDRENHFIKIFNSIENGYNSTPARNPNRVLDRKTNRININVSDRDKEYIFSLAREKRMTVTDLILRALWELQ